MARRTTGAVCWQNFVTVAGRFQRSVHLERDAADIHWLDDYILTPLVRSTVERVASGLASTATHRAWSVTGPYGSGKSALALFLSHLLTVPKAAEARRARRQLTRECAELADTLFKASGPLRGKKGLVAVRATGERASFELVLLKALADAAEDFWSGRGAKPEVLWELAVAVEAASDGERVGTRHVVSLFEEVAEKIAASNRYGRGLLVILDEAGKTLEHAAHGGDAGDVHLLQELAEAASRSGDTPIVFMVLLHQGFEHYASRLSTLQRNEWAKVQGRFDDVAFQEADDQLLRLMAAAIEQDDLPPKHRARLLRCATHVSRVVSSNKRQQRRIAELLRNVLPLHPVTALALGPLFRSRLAQNERSLFAFLSSTEPMGFQRFLAERRGTKTPLLYMLDELYDYVQVTLGGRLFGRQARHWALIETALRRLPEDAETIDARVVKVIGLLTALGDAHDLRPSRNLIDVALSDAGRVTSKDVSAALDRLKSASILVYRKYLDAYQLWEGSDLDLDTLVASARSEGTVLSSLVAKLAKVAPPRPLVARKHLFETGTLRYFELRYADESIVDQLEGEEMRADGVIHLVIPSDDRAAKDLERRLKQPMTWLGLDRAECKPVLVALPTELGELRELATELGALEWVQTHTPALRDDATARHELESRIAYTAHLLRERLAALGSGRAHCAWYWRGKTIAVDSAHSLARLLSRICDDVYASAPTLHNELLNRANLSSSAAAARRALLTAMIEHPEEERLGITGFPPEYSMYRSLLEATGMHRKGRSGWKVKAPRGKLQPAWQELQRMLDDSEQQRFNVATAYHRLRLPPFGMKDGPLPVLLLAAILDGQAEIALYEESVFVPRMTAPVVERLLRSPERFELQRFRIAGARRAFFNKLASTLSTDGARDEASMLDVVRHLVRFAGKLPAYVRNSHQISETARGVREVLLRAREPAPLLFRDLPVACGFKPLPTRGRRSGTDIDEFVDTLRAALSELQQAYPQLLDQLEQSIAEAFGLPRAFKKMRRELAMRSERLMPAAFDSKLKSFLVRASDEVLDREGWVVSVATLLGGKPPASWRDDDLEQARLNLAMLRRRFFALEGMLMEGEGEALADGTELIRIAVAQSGEGEHEQIVALRGTDLRQTKTVEAALRATLDAGRADLPRDLVLAALANVARDLISELNREQTARPEETLQ